MDGPYGDCCHQAAIIFSFVMSIAFISPEIAPPQIPTTSLAIDAPALFDLNSAIRLRANFSNLLWPPVPMRKSGEARTLLIGG
jgi:hypothetical protein